MFQIKILITPELKGGIIFRSMGIASLAVGLLGIGFEFLSWARRIGVKLLPTFTEKLIIERKFRCRAILRSKALAC